MAAAKGAERTAAILELVDAIPVGRVMTYGDVAAALGIGSARLVGQALAHHGASVAWQRVVRADGSVAPHLVARQIALLKHERTPLRSDTRVDLRAARWSPAADR